MFLQKSTSLPHPDKLTATPYRLILTKHNDTCSMVWCPHEGSRISKSESKVGQKDLKQENE